MASCSYRHLCLSCSPCVSPGSSERRTGGSSVRARTHLALLLTLVLSLVTIPPAVASPADHYTGPYFGADNFPPECIGTCPGTTRTTSAITCGRG